MDALTTVSAVPSPDCHTYFTTVPPGNGSVGLAVPNPVLTLTLAVVGAGLMVKSGPIFLNSAPDLGVPTPLGPSNPLMASHAPIPAEIASAGV